MMRGHIHSVANRAFFAHNLRGIGKSGIRAQNSSHFFFALLEKLQIGWLRMVDGFRLLFGVRPHVFLGRRTPNTCAVVTG